MKKFMTFPAALILTLSVFTGCGCRKMTAETIPTTAATLPPVVTTAPTTEATTEMTTLPTETHTVPSQTVPDGMDPDNNTTSPSITPEGKARTPGRMVK